jgi:hypothetical protein
VIGEKESKSLSMLVRKKLGGVHSYRFADDITQSPHASICPLKKREERICKQGCQMVHFRTKNANLGKYWWALEWKNVGIFYVHLEYNIGHLVYFMVIW